MKGWLGLWTGAVVWAAAPVGLEGPLADLRAVGPQGNGNVRAAVAWGKVAGAGAAAIPGILEAMDGANDYAVNWIRLAVETVAQRELAAGRTLPVAALEGFLADVGHHPRARYQAYELIRRVEAERAAGLLPRFVNDPGNELRRDAVQALVTAAAAREASDKAGALAGYRDALRHAREADQIEEIAKALGGLGETVDLMKVFGWVTRWKVIGPFDNTGGAGWATEFGPEKALDFGAELDGKKGKVRWVDYETKNEYGLVDFNQPFTSLKEVTGYATTEFWSETARTAQVRLGCKNGWKVWVNGKLLFARDEYHRAAEIDQYRLPVELKAGRNVLLVKCCQNEQTEDWTKEWEFQLRITDGQGTPIFSTR
jgi:hypothetical protein